MLAESNSDLTPAELKRRLKALLAVPAAKAKGHDGEKKKRAQKGRDGEGKQAK